MSKPRPILRPLVIPPPTTSTSLQNITAIHKPIRTFTTTAGKEPPTSPLTPDTLTAIPITPPLLAPQKASRNVSNNNNNTPAAIDSIPLTPLPSYNNSNTSTSQQPTRRNPPTSTTPHPGTPGRAWESDLESQAARVIRGLDAYQKTKDEKKEEEGGSLWTRRQDLRFKIGIIAACVGAVVGVVGLTVYFVVLKARGEI